MVWKNSYTLPGIKNNDIPERAVRQDIVVPETTGIQRTKADQISPPIFNGNSYKTQFISPLNGLKRIALLVTNSLQSENDYDIKVIVTDTESGVSSEQLVSSKGFQGNRWFDVSLNEFRKSKGRVFAIEVVAEKAKESDKLAVYMDDDKRLSLVTYHNPVTAYQ